MSEKLTPRDLGVLDLRASLRNFYLAVVMVSSPVGGLSTPQPEALVRTEPVITQNFGDLRAGDFKEYFEELAESRVEEKFGITLSTLKETINEGGWDLVKEWNIDDNKEYDWTFERLNVLSKALPLLPEHFYSPDSEGWKRNLVSLPLDDKNAVCICHPSTRKPDFIYISGGTFKSENFTYVLKTLTHELTHGVQPWVTEKPGSDDPNDYTSPWIERRDEIISRDEIQEIAEKVKSSIAFLGNAYLERLWDNLDNLNNQAPGDEKRFFAFRLLYGLGFPSPRVFGDHGEQDINRYNTEFFAVLAETYIGNGEKGGREYFFEMYGDYFTEVQVGQLYEFTKKEIFGGWEYDKNFEPIKLTIYS